MPHGRLLAITATAGLAATTVLLTTPASAAPNDKAKPENRGQSKTVSLSAQLSPLNGSGTSGTATAVVRNQLIRDITVDVHGATPDAPHAQHIHYGDDARNECPTVAMDDVDDDGLVSTIEGVPAYGPIVVSLTTTGDTSPASGLAVTRFPVSMHGSYHYSRSNIEFTDVAGTGYTGGGGTAKQIADAIRDGEGVVVVHGADLNGNGTYDGVASTLDPSLPREATIPAACGVLQPHGH